MYSQIISLITFLSVVYAGTLDSIPDIKAYVDKQVNAIYKASTESKKIELLKQLKINLKDKMNESSKQEDLVFEKIVSLENEGATKDKAFLALKAKYEEYSKLREMWSAYDTAFSYIFSVFLIKNPKGYLSCDNLDDEIKSFYRGNKPENTELPYEAHTALELTNHFCNKPIGKTKK